MESSRSDFTSISGSNFRFLLDEEFFCFCEVGLLDTEFFSFGDRDSSEGGVTPQCIPLDELCPERVERGRAYEAGILSFGLSTKKAGLKVLGDRCGEGGNREAGSSIFNTDDLKTGIEVTRGPGVGTNDGS